MRRTAKGKRYGPITANTLAGQNSSGGKDDWAGGATAICARVLRI